MLYFRSVVVLAPGSGELERLELRIPLAESVLFKEVQSPLSTLIKMLSGTQPGNTAGRLKHSGFFQLLSSQFEFTLELDSTEL